MNDMDRKRDLEALARAWISLWQGGDLSAFDDLHAPDFVDHSPSGRAPDRAGFRQGLIELYRAFPDFHGALEDLLIDPATGAITLRWSATGTHRGAFLGRAPTGREIRFTGVEIIHADGGRITARWGEWDGLDLLEQLDEPSASGDAPVSPLAQHILTILAVEDLSRAARFYREAFNWPTRVEVPVFVEFELPDGRGLGVYQREGFARNAGQMPELPAPGAISGAEIYLRCDDLGAAIARVERAGGRRLSARAPRDWGDEAAYYADPDGHVVVVARPLRPSA